MVLEPAPVILAREQYEVFSKKLFDKLVKKINPDNENPLFLHICGNISHLLSSMSKSKANGLSLDSKVNFSNISEKVPEEITIMGNLDPIKVFLNSNSAEV